LQPVSFKQAALLKRHRTNVRSVLSFIKQVMYYLTIIVGENGLKIFQSC
jgi:hypothetical protein